MRLLSLHLKAFGPFTDATLDLSAGNQGLHVIYGPNEAGKSSALRALKYLFFGIPVRTTDSFLHPNPKLRIGARLAHRDGSEIVFVRRKGLSKTLRSADDETLLDDDALSPYLGGVDEALFTRMFGIGHDDLVAGGRDIVDGGGSVGEALFTAGAGLIRLQNVQQGITAESDALFKPSGSRPRINATLSALKDIRAAQKAAVQSGASWKTHDRALRAARSELEKVQQDLNHCRQAHHRLTRIRDALSMVARKREIDALLPAYAGVPVLPDDFPNQRRDLETIRKMAARDGDTALREMARIDEALSALTIPGALLDRAAAVEALQQELGSSRKAQKDRPALMALMQSLRKEARARLADIAATGDTTDAPTLPVGVTTDIQLLGKTYDRLATRREAALEAQRKLTVRIEALNAQVKQLPPPVDTTRLKAALDGARAAGAVTTRLQDAQAACRTIAADIDAALKRQQLWTGTSEALESLPIPPRETIDMFAANFDDARRLSDACRAEAATTDSDLAQVATDLDALERTREVPTEKDLIAARLLRDQGWALVSQTLTGGDPPKSAAFLAHFPPAASLAEAFVESITRADAIADRLRREAERVNRKGALLARRDHLAERLQKHRAALTAAETGQAALENRWHDLWAGAGLSPRSPREMRAWTEDMAILRGKIAERREREEKRSAIAAEIETLSSALQTALDAAGAAVPPASSLTERISTATAWLDTQGKHHQQSEAIDREQGIRRSELADVESQLKGLAEAFADWKTQWGDTVAAIGLEAGVTPAAAAAMIENLRAARSQMDEAAALAKRIEGIDRDADAFGKQVTSLCEAVAPDIADAPPPVAAVELNARLTAAREARSRQSALKAQRTAAAALLEASQKRLAEAGARLSSLCRDAGVAAPEDLPGVENRSREKQRLQDDLAAVEERLRGLSAGATVAEFVADALTVDADGIGVQIEHLDSRLAALDDARTTLIQTIATEENELRRTDGSGRAAEHAEAAEGLLARLEADAVQYARLRIAASVLAGAIEDYREKNQGPLIERAGALFSRMSAGAFQGIRAEYDDRGNPVLVGVRPDGGDMVRVAGMSDGSADQLYLALRLASLEQYLAHNEPLPFIVDDILLRFDDARAAATLQVLAALSEKTQVIFFTHHRHLVDLAKGTCAHPGVVFHDL